MIGNSTRRSIGILGIFFSLFHSGVAQCGNEPILPYTERTHSFNGWRSTVGGDVRTLGMAGATVGLADTFIASVDNPAGLAMTLIGADFNYTSNTVHDGFVQNYETPLELTYLGVALNAYPWAISLGYHVPYMEGQDFLFQNPTPGGAGIPGSLRVSTRAFQIAGASLFADNKLSLGVALVFFAGEREITLLQPTPITYDQSGTAIGARIGASYVLPAHLILGMSYQFAMNLPGADPSVASPGVPGFLQQPIRSPGRLGLGLGWIPNRFFRADLTNFLVGKNEDSALVADQEVRIGQSVTIQPRFGIGYNFADFKEFRATFFAGTYLEVSRIQNQPNRIHATTGVELKPWIFTIGSGIDKAHEYTNFLFSIGVDLFKVGQKIDVVPPVAHPPYSGFHFQPMHMSDEGLPRPLVKNWKDQDSKIDPIEIGLSIPKRLYEKAKELTSDKPKKLKSEKKG